METLENRYRIEYNNHTQKDYEDAWNIESSYFEPFTVSSIKQVMEWDKKNDNINIFVRDTQLNKIVGEITLLPLTKNQFQDFMNDRLDDTELSANDLQAYMNNATYYLLFSAIAIDKNYRKDKLVLSCLLNGLNARITNLLERNIKFANMCAEGQTAEGQRFIENFLNLKEKNITKEGYKLYSFNDADEINQWLKIFPQYIEKYDETFK